MSTPEHPLGRESLLKALPRNPAGDPILGGMHLQSRLGKGAMGAVYKGHHPRLNVAVAVKVLPPNLADPKATEQAARWFQREAQLLWQVQSTNVVRVSDVGQDAGLHYMVMDYVHGMPLPRFLTAYDALMVQPERSEAPAGDGGPGAKTAVAAGVSESIAVAICLAAARGLEALHEKGIIHRDIKPDNILIPYRSGYQRLNDITELDFDKTQLVDLGIARQEKDDNSTQQGMIMGTPAYMAPEQARGLEASKSSDTYAIGATLFYLLAGQAPYQGKNPAELVVQVAHEPPLAIESVCPGLSAATRQLLLQCMQREPAKRFEDGKALRRACERLAAQIPPDAITRRLFRLPENSAIAAAVKLPVPAEGALTPTAPMTTPRGDGRGPSTTGTGTRGGLPPTEARRGKTSKQAPVSRSEGSASGAGAGSTGKTRSKQTPVAVADAGAVGVESGRTESAPEVDFAPAFEASELALESPERAQWEGQLIRLRAMDDVYATWMVLPVAAWGLLTVGGAFWNGNVAGAILVAVISGAICALPYILGGRFRKVAAGLSIAMGLCGWVILEQVGQFLIPAARRALQNVGGAATFNDWLQTAVVGLVAVVTLIGIGHSGMYYWHERRKQATVRNLEAEVQRLTARKAKKK